ncbi:MAG: GNAT family N-acetyltransferase [Lentisphaeria bacterium]|nr:GNAT family N-acetyltransferase [Lentisphaeria bacterium]
MDMRTYRPEDLAAVMEIANKAWQEIRKMSRAALGDRISDLFHPGGDAVSKGIQVREQIESGLYHIAVCEHEGEIVGFITTRIEGFSGEICNNAARPGTGLKGVGQLMYQYALEYFRSRGVKVVQVTTGLDDAHAPARRAYERAGFTRRLESVTYFMELD